MALYSRHACGRQGAIWRAAEAPPPRGKGASRQRASRRLYSAAAELSADAFAEGRGVFFDGMKGSLNHLLATDRIWMRRLPGKVEAPDSLDGILDDDVGTLREARQAEDRRISAFVASLTDETLSADFTYRPITNPRDLTQPLGPALAHIFSHQTHHRG